MNKIHVYVINSEIIWGDAQSNIYIYLKHYHIQKNKNIHDKLNSSTLNIQYMHESYILPIYYYNLLYNYLLLQKFMLTIYN